MPEITIPLPEPAVEAAKPARTFNQIYIRDLAVRAHTVWDPELTDEENYAAMAADSIYVEYTPYDQPTGAQLLTDKREIRLDLWEAVNAVPEAAQAFGAIALCIPALVAYQAAKLAAAEAAALAAQTPAEGPAEEPAE